jgi:hypothetical protein
MPGQKNTRAILYLIYARAFTQSLGKTVKTQQQDAIAARQAR